MGCASSCSIFEAFSSALEWVAKTKLGVAEMVHYIDDFLFLAESSTKCTADMNAFISLCEQMGVPLAPKKTQGPATVLSFLGIILDTEKLEARLPNPKLAKCKSMIADFLTRQKVSLQQLQSLLGLLGHDTCVVSGRCFLRRLIDMTIGVTRPHHHIRLTKQAKLDLAVWQEFLHNCNGTAFFLTDRFHTDGCLYLYTDASGSVGYGAVYGKKWVWEKWPFAWFTRNIAVLELFPIMAAVVVWGGGGGGEWANQNVRFFTDNEALVSVINKQTSRDPP